MYRTNIIQWHEQIRIRNSAHLALAQKHELWHNVIGFTAILAAIIAGYKVMHPNQYPLPWWAIIIGVFAIIAAFSNAALKFFGFESRMKKHHAAASHYASLQYEMERWLMEPEENIPEGLYDRISKQLSKLEKDSPIIAKNVYKKAEEKVKGQAIGEIPDHRFYNIQLFESWKVENGRTVEIGDNPVRSYICDPLEMYEYPRSKKIRINGRITMTRQENKIPIELQGEGIINNNNGFLQYFVRDISTGNITYGTMVLPLTSKVEIEGHWMTAGLVGAAFLIGTIKMTLKSNGDKV